MLRVLVVASVVALAGCVQHAIEAPPLRAMPDDKSLGAMASDTRGLKRFVIDPKRSKVAIEVYGLLVASTTVRADRFHGEILTDGAESVGRIAFVVDLGSLHGDPEPMVEDAKREVLEVSRFPDTTLDAWFRRGDDAHARVVEGNLTLHGVEKGIRFDAKLRHESGGERVDASFYLSRKTFDLMLDEEFEAIIDDDFRVEVSLFATPG